MSRLRTWSRRVVVPTMVAGLVAGLTGLLAGLTGAAMSTPARAGTSPSAPTSGKAEPKTITPQASGLQAPDADCTQRPAHPNFDNSAGLLPDIATGVPGDNTSEADASGAVEIRYADGPTEVVRPPNPQPGERLGGAMTVTDFNADSCDDLVVGAPGRTVDGQSGAGAVHLWQGTPNGLRYVGLVTQANDAIPGEPSADAQFGSSLDAFGPTGDSDETHVYLGAPGLTVNGAEGAGGVFSLMFATQDDGSLQFDGALTTLDTNGVPGESEKGDALGHAVTAHGSGWAAGAPGARVGDQERAGLVLQAAENSQQHWLIHQGRNNVQGAYEADDRFGTAIDSDTGNRLIIGVPGEDLGGTEDAGMINLTQPSSTDDPTPIGDGGFTQNTTDDGTGDPVEGIAEADDRFGTAVLTWPRRGGSGADYIWSGVPGEAIGSVPNAGTVTGLYGAESRAQTESGGETGQGNAFGSSLSYGWGERDSDAGDTFAIGAPGTSSGQGAVSAVSGMATDWEEFRFDPAAAGDKYGAALGTTGAGLG